MKDSSPMAALHIYAALSDDIASWDRGLQPQIDEFNRLFAMRVEQLGYQYFMISLPEVDKAFSKALSSGWINYDACPEFTRDISFLLDLIFDADGYELPDLDPTAVFFAHQVLLMGKKIKKECTSATISAEVSNFVRIDSCLRKPTFNWHSDDLGLSAQRVSLTDGYRPRPDLISGRDDCALPLLRAAQAVADIAFGQYPQLDWRDIRPRHGPGAVADARSGTDKYLFPSWPVKLETLFPESYFAYSREDLHLTDPVSRSSLEPPARLIAVPKTLKAPRLIASEPTSHQFLQLGLMRWMRDFLPPCLLPSISFHDQRPSQVAAKKASVDGLSATVDLSAASDRLSCWVVERMCRVNPSLLLALHAVRTRAVTNCTGHGPDFTMLLNKLGNMGAGTTFPLQTLIYTILAIASIAYDRGIRISAKSIRRLSREVRVFGDDIILPSHAVWPLATLLTHLELKVNHAKTHWRGHFRESCGKDYYKGVDVTPLYISDLSLRATASSISSWIDVSNNAYRMGLWHVSDYMLSQVPRDIRRKLPVSSRPVGCLSLATYGASIHTGKTRFNNGLQRYEVYGLVPYTKRVRRKRETYSNLLQYFVEDPSPEDFWESGYTVQNRSLLRDLWVYWPN